MSNKKRPLSSGLSRSNILPDSGSRIRSSIAKKDDKIKVKNTENKLYDSKAAKFHSRETMSSMGLVVNLGLFGLEKGLKTPYQADNCTPLLPFTILASILNEEKYSLNGRIVPFVINQDPYSQMIEEVSALPNLNSLTLNQTSLYSEDAKPEENIAKLLEACQYISRDIILGLLNEIFSCKIDNGFALLQSPGKISDSSKKAEIEAIEISISKGQQTRVLVINWDAVHSKQLQNAFYDRSDVLVISLHRSGLTHSESTGVISEIGVGSGIGKNINASLPNNDFDNSSLFYIFQHIILPIATEFQPTLVMITTSFDAFCGDELGTVRVSSDIYAHMVYMLRSLAGGKIAVCLDCDNSVSSITSEIHAVASVLLAQSPPRLDITLNPTRSGIKVVSDLIQSFSPYWDCLKMFNQTQQSNTIAF